MTFVVTWNYIEWLLTTCSHSTCWNYWKRKSKAMCFILTFTVAWFSYSYRKIVKRNLTSDCVLLGFAPFSQVGIYQHLDEHATWRWYIPTRLHSATIQKATMKTLTTVETFSLTIYGNPLLYAHTVVMITIQDLTLAGTVFHIWTSELTLSLR
jgi:hypothetical protein